MSEQVYEVLLVDDDKEVLRINGEYLRKKGYFVSLAENVEDALEKVTAKAPDCIILDVMMPGMDGFEGLKELKKVTDAPILFLTGRVSEEDRIRGLSSGADDYIIKPCSLEELALRIMIHIRKANRLGKNDNTLEFPPLRIELLEHKAFCGGEEIILSNREYELLAFLAQNPNRELTFEAIGIHLYGSFLDTDRKNIMVTASRLRKKLEGYIGTEKMIETIWGKGYCFRG